MVFSVRLANLGGQEGFATRTLEGLCWLFILGAAFALPLVVRWSTGATDGYVLGGLVPWSDAAGYYADALRLLDGHRLSTQFPGRPPYASVLAALLLICNRNLQAALVVQTAIVAGSCLLFTWTIRRTNGVAAAALILALLGPYAARFVGATSTENLGIAFGAIAAALLWRSAHRHELALGAAGLFFLTAAQAARPGALMILPAILAWGTGHFRHQFRRWIFAGGTAVTLVLLLNAALYRSIGAPGVTPMANYSYVLYGLATGGAWQSIYEDHPEVVVLPLSESAPRFYALALEGLRADPTVAANTALRAWRLFLIDYSPFPYLRSWDSRTYIRSIGAIMLLQWLCCVGIAACFSGRRTAPDNPTGSFLLAVTAGVVASVPFAPPWDSDSMRVYAATMPLTAALPAVGLAWLLRRPRGLRALAQIGPGASLASFGASLVGAALTLVTAAGPIIKWAAPPTEAARCDSGVEAVRVRVPRGTHIELSGEGPTLVPKVLVGDFRAGIGEAFELLYPDEVPVFRHLPAGTRLATVIDARSGTSMLLIASGLEVDNHVQTICGHTLAPPRSGAVPILIVP